MPSNGGNDGVSPHPQQPDEPHPPWLPKEVVIDASVLNEAEFARFLSALAADARPPAPARGQPWERAGRPGRDEPLRVLLHEELRATALGPGTAARRAPTTTR